MMTLEEIMNKLKDMNLSKVSANSGISYNIIYRISKGDKNTKYEHIEKLSKYLKG
jgi:predicted transcriptional regulator